MNDLVLYARDERVAVLTLNRPEKRNALSPELVTSLLQSIQRAQTDPEVGAIVLTGAGDKAFCAGADLGGAPMGDGLLGLHEGRRGFADLLHAMSTSRKPLVGAANGLALAGGFGLLLACDVAVVPQKARFGTPEIKRGLFPMMIVAVLLRTLGRRRTLELALTGQEIDGATLERWGGCNHALEDPAAVLPRATAIAAHMAGFSPAVLALGRQAVFSVEDMSFSQQLDYLRSALTLNTLAEDAGEGIAAFFEKRAPAWKGR